MRREAMVVILVVAGSSQAAGSSILMLALLPRPSEDAFGLHEVLPTVRHPCSCFFDSTCR
jgi:hypothetical protein